MALTGIILAGGDATRLPNKALLPLHGGRIVVESAVRFVCACNDIRIVIKEGSLLPLIGKSRGWSRYTYCIQKGIGIGSAIRAGVEGLPDEENCVITFCDNLYGTRDRELLIKLDARAKRVATVRHLRTHSTELDYWEDGVWKNRPAPPESWFFAGFLFAQAVIFKQFGDTITGSLNCLDFHPEMITGDSEWADLGTVDSYREYLDEA